MAAHLGLANMVRVVLDRGAGRIPSLHRVGNNVDVVRMLMDHGADLWEFDERGRTPLDCALETRQDWAATYLREQMAASPERAGLHHAAAAGDLERLAELLGRSDAVDTREPVRRRTPLHVAVLREQIGAVRWLTAHGADVNAADTAGHFCLTLVPGSNLRLLNLLFERGAKPNQPGPEGLTPFLWHERERSGVKMLRALIAGGADPKAQAADGRNALDLAPTDMPAARHFVIEALGVAPDQDDLLNQDVKAFAVRARDPKFQTLAARLAEIFGRKPSPWKPAKGGFYYHEVSLAKYGRETGVLTMLLTGTEQTRRQFVAVQDEVRAEGFMLLHNEPRPEGGRASLILLPTADPYAALLARRTNGANYSLDTRAIIAWLRELDAANPWVLTACGVDFLVGRFLAPVQEADAWAAKMLEFCPDLGEAGPQTARRLARELEEYGWFAFWWD